MPVKGIIFAIAPALIRVCMAIQLPIPPIKREEKGLVVWPARRNK